MAQPNRTPESESVEENLTFHALGGILSSVERGIFVVVGILLFIAALGLMWNAFEAALPLFSGPIHETIRETAEFLNLVLLIMMIAEIAYTVALSVRGRTLSAHPFLVVALIAVVRRILVITVDEVQNHGVSTGALVSKSSIDVAILTLVVLAFVFAIYLLGKTRP